MKVETTLPLNKAVHTSRSRVRVGRGSDEIDQLDSLAGAITPKPPVNAKKAKRDRLQTDIAGWRTACTRLKKVRNHNVDYERHTINLE